MIFLKLDRMELELLIKAGFDPRHIFGDSEIYSTINTKIEEDRKADKETKTKTETETEEGGSPF